MNQQGSQPNNRELARQAATRKFLVSAAAAVGVVLIVAFMTRSVWPRTETVPPPEPPAIIKPVDQPAAHFKRFSGNPALREVQLWDHPTGAAASSSRRSTTLKPAVPQANGSSMIAQQLIARLLAVDRHGTLTREQAEELNQLLHQLVEQGAAAVPAIRDFLAKNEDLDFDAISGGQYVDVGTLRLGMIAALQQIKDPAAMDTMVQTLQSTADPLELAVLTGGLENLAPNEYRQMEVAAARESLAMAAKNQLDGRDASPVFEVLQMYGDASVAADLAGAVSKWNYWATLALAGLPNGAGIPSLIHLAQDPSLYTVQGGDIALRPLAQAALQYPDALNALVNLAQANQIPDNAWPGVAAALRGTYLQYGSQVLLQQPPTTWSDAQIQARVAMIDQLLAGTANPAGRQALQSARNSLTNKTP